MPKNESTVPLKMLLFSYQATHTIIISFLPLYLMAKGFTGTEIGWVLAVGPFASIFSQPLWGYMSDKYQTVKKILLLLMSLVIITSIIFFQMDSLIGIITIGAFLFFFSTPIGALGDSLAQRRSHELGVTFGSIKTWGSLGFATSTLVVGVVLDRIGVENMMIPYLFFGIIALIVMFQLTDVEVTNDPVQLSDLALLLKNKPFIIFLGLMTFITITHRVNDSFMGVYLAELGGSESLVGLAWFVGVVSEAIVFFLAAFWFRKFHTLIFVILAGILYSVRWFLFGQVTDPMHIIYLQFLHGLTFGIFYNAAFDYVSRLIPRVLESTGHLMFYAVFFGVSGIIGSLGGGLIIDLYGGATLYTSLGWLALIGTILFTLYHSLPFFKPQ